MSTSKKTLCEGSGSVPREVRLYQGLPSRESMGQCGTCERILKVAPNGRLRKHSVRGKNTASHDRTMGILWESATTEEKLNQHFAIGLAVYVRPGAKPAGWDDPLGDEFVPDHWSEDDYHRRYPITAVHEATSEERSSFEAGGWYWWPEDLTVAH